MTKKIELLSPAGSEKSLKAAVNSGADSVYMGTTFLNARMGAENFGEEKIEANIKYAKLRGVKVYITLNTIVYNNELESIIPLVKNIHEMGADAVIVQDLGVADIIRNNLKINMHASTQMSCHNLPSVKLLEKIGFSRAVMARETSIEDIKNIAKNTKVELEIFAHGALCSGFSGQCLYSFIKGGRSGNRGCCAQPCRMIYNGASTDYPLSTKDLMTIEILPSLIESGITAFKIEGRIKRSEYVEVTTRIYRSAIDLILENKDIPIEKYKEELIKIYNRGGFTKGYYFKEQDIFGNARPNHMGEYIGEVVNYKNNKIYINSIKTLNVYDGISFGNTGMEISDMYDKDGNRVKNAVGLLSFSAILKGIKKGDKVYRTTDKTQIDMANKVIESDTFKHHLNLVCNINDSITLSTRDNEFKAIYKSDYKIENAKTNETTKEQIIEHLKKTGNTVFTFDNIEVNIDGRPFIPIKILNDARRNLISILEGILIKSEDKEYDKNIFSENAKIIKTNDIKIAVINDITNVENIESLKKYNYKILAPKIYDKTITEYFKSKKIDGIILPHITFDSDIEIIKSLVNKDMIVICNNLGQIEALRDLCQIWAGTGLNAVNDKAVDFLYKIGSSLVISSIESKEKLKNTVSIRKGLIPVMSFVLCPKSMTIGCDKCKEKNITDENGRILKFDCVTIKNKVSFILENIENKQGEIDII